MDLKEKFSYSVFVFCLILFLVWPFLVFFHFIWFGLVLLMIFSAIGAVLWEVFRGARFVEHKVVHEKPKTN